MILYVEGDLFQSPAQVLVNTVNTVGVMGRGIALEFKRLFPDMYAQYRDLCEREQLSIGMLWLYKTEHKWILNFPTKQHWREPSREEYIEKGLQKFCDTYRSLSIHSIAFPALGCGNGQLDFESQIQPLMQRYLRSLPIDVFIYPGSNNIFVEHLSPEKMKDWLRTEPTALPFTEVWDDLVDLLAKQSQFETLVKNRLFTAHISQEPLGISIAAATQVYFIEYETLMAFWQQLRTHGFSMRHIAPGINREVSYLIPIFAALDYITPVHVAENYNHLQKSAITGLQILPSAFSRQTGQIPDFAQMTLFQLS